MGGVSRAMAAQRKPFPRLFLARPEPFRLVGEQVFLRPPERGDYEEWASLRARSRNFLTPWEPSWPPDALSRAGFRARISRYAEDWRTVCPAALYERGPAAGSRLRLRPATPAPGRGRVSPDQRAEPRAIVAHRVSAGGLRPQLSADRRQAPGPPVVRNPARGLARVET